MCENTEEIYKNATRRKRETVVDNGSPGFARGLPYEVRCAKFLELSSKVILFEELSKNLQKANRPKGGNIHQKQATTIRNVFSGPSFCVRSGHIFAGSNKNDGQGHL